MSLKQRGGTPEPLEPPGEIVDYRKPMYNYNRDDVPQSMDEVEEMATAASQPLTEREQFRVNGGGRATPSDIKAAYANKLRATAAAIHNALSFYKAGINAPVQDDEQLSQRIEKFFKDCASQGQIPTFEKMCLALGYPKAEVSGWENGSISGFTPHTGVIIRQAKLALSAIDADLAMQGQIQASIYQFRAKNYSGMKETGDTTQPKQNNEPSVSLKEILQSAKQLPGYNKTDAAGNAAEGASTGATEGAGAERDADK